MADRVKYFVLGLLFLVVAAVIAYDSWNTTPTDIPDADQTAKRDGCSDHGDGEPMNVLSDVPGPDTDNRDRRNPGSGDSPALNVGLGADEAKRASVANGYGNGDPRNGELGGGNRGDRRFDEGPGSNRDGNRNRAAPIERNPESRTEPKRGARTEPARNVPARTHIVRANENLEKIAIKYYGTRRGVAWIVTANRLSNPDRIFEKQELIIPARKELSGVPGHASRRPAGKRAKTAKRSGGTAPTTYTVKSGEDLYKICRRLYGQAGQGARVSRIMDLNGLYTARVKAGTVLRLPPR